MNDNDELRNIPPMVPDRDDVDSHLTNKKAQSQEIVRPAYYTEKVKVSSWGVRVMLILLSLSVIGAGAGAYFGYEEYQRNSLQAELRIADLERRLSLAGNSAEDSALNMMERMDFNFSEIDKLWAARRVINGSMEDVQSEIAKLALTNNGQNETVANNSQQIASTNQSIVASDTRLNSLNTEMTQLGQNLAAMDASFRELEGMRSDMEAIRQTLNSGDDTVLGLAGRLEYVEQSMESVNAHRLQINESLFRLQEDIEGLQRSLTPPGSQ
jgi:chromosome segregation ATPase